MNPSASHPLLAVQVLQNPLRMFVDLENDDQQFAKHPADYHRKNKIENPDNNADDVRQRTGVISPKKLAYHPNG